MQKRCGMGSVEVLAGVWTSAAVASKRLSMLPVQSWRLVLAALACVSVARVFLVGSTCVGVALASLGGAKA